ncbi:MAG: hypothetical protein ACO2OS_01520 [Thermosphaera aggregans]|jgi:hypothetical protein|uniref:hypothetical protein n=1 Tax=Thermosphaera aggregans TaxID=54254 RepID=UPI003BFAD06F
MNKKIFRERFLGLHIGEIFRSQINPFYIIRLGTYTYYYFVIIDLNNEELLSVSTTSFDMINKMKEYLKSGEVGIFIGKYALVFQDRVLTCGSLKIINSKNPSFRKMPDQLRSVINHIERFIKTPSLYSQLALFPVYVFKNSQNSLKLYNSNTRLIVNSEGQFCRTGFILGNAYLHYDYVDPIDKLPFIEYYPNKVAVIKSIVCRPDSSYTDSPLKCTSIRFKALVNKALVPQKMSSSESPLSGLLYVSWCPKLKIGMPILVGFKNVNAEELANFTFGKTLLLSSIERGEFQFLIPEERLRRIYDTLVREIEIRLRIEFRKHVSIEEIIRKNEQHNLLFRLQRKLIPITIKMYLQNWLIFEKGLKQIFSRNIVNSFREKDKKSTKLLTRESVVRPFERCNDALMII